MSRFLALTLASSTAVVSTAALAATTKERVRGAVMSIEGDMLIVHTTSELGRAGYAQQDDPLPQADEVESRSRRSGQLYWHRDEDNR